MNIRLYAAQSPLDAEIVISLLRSHGLHPPDLAWSPHVSLAGGELCYDVNIPATEAASAVAILQAKGLVQGLALKIHSQDNRGDLIHHRTD